MSDKENIIPNFDSIKNWEEDYPYENGNYINKCIECKGYFFGHKRRYICKECINKDKDISLFT